MRGAEALGASLREGRAQSRLFRTLATLRTDVPLAESLEALQFRGALPELKDLCASLGIPDLAARVPRRG